MLLVDTGIFIAAGDRNEPSHQSCADLLRSRSDLAIVAPAVAETSWLIEDRLGQSTLATLNHRDFAGVRPAHRDAFELVPGHHSTSNVSIAPFEALT